MRSDPDPCFIFGLRGASRLLWDTCYLRQANRHHFTSQHVGELPLIKFYAVALAVQLAWAVADSGVSPSLMQSPEEVGMTPHAHNKIHWMMPRWEISCHAKSKLPNHLKRHKNSSLSPYLETPRNTYKLKKDQHDREVRP